MSGVPVAVAGGAVLGVSSGLRRVGSAAVLIPLFVGVVVAPAWVFQAVVVVVSAAAAWELLRMFGVDGTLRRPMVAVAAAAVTASFGVPGAPVAVLTAGLLLVLAASLATPPAPSGGVVATTSEPTLVAILALVYVGWLLGHALPLRARPDGAALVLVLVGVTWVGETAAYAVGSTMGRHRLAPVISPKKTVEGGVAQVVASVVGAALLGAWLLGDWPLARSVAAGALLGVSGQLGDLAESVMKRSMRVKDTGGLIPGHGGMLDRIDGLLVNVPVFLYFVRWTATP